MKPRKSPLYASDIDKANFIQEILDRCRHKATNHKIEKLEKLIEKLKEEK